MDEFEPLTEDQLDAYQANMDREQYEAAKEDWLDRYYSRFGRQGIRLPRGYSRDDFAELPNWMLKRNGVHIEDIANELGIGCMFECAILLGDKYAALERMRDRVAA